MTLRELADKLTALADETGLASELMDVYVSTSSYAGSSVVDVRRGSRSVELVIDPEVVT